MIAHLDDDFNINLEAYYYLCDNADFSSVYCSTCKGHTKHYRHAYYTRHIYISGKLVEITILRIICTVCGTTHAVLPLFIVPYLRHDPLTIKDAYINPKSICDNKLYYLIVKLKRKLKRFFKAIKLTINDSIEELYDASVSTFYKALFQLHNGYPVKNGLSTKRYISFKFLL